MLCDMHSFIIPLEKIFKDHADEQHPQGAKAYLLNQFEHYGLKTPLRRKLCKEYFNRQLPAYSELERIVKELWQLPQREYQYGAVELLVYFKMEWKKDCIALFEYMITHKSWWDSVDHIASELTGPYFRTFPLMIATTTRRWNRSDNIWLQRSSLMFQKAYREATNTKLLSEYIIHCRRSNEFFVQKAIGWALREYSKTNPRWVQQFVRNNQLPALSTREALKRILKK